MVNGAFSGSSTLEVDPADLLGKEIDGRYRVESMIGEGGMGTVYLGTHLKLGKKVAIKVIHPEYAEDGSIAERFAREAVTTGQLDHPHIAGALDYGTLPEGSAYLVMPYVRGRTLTHVINDGPAQWVRVAEVGAQVADALAAAHGAGVIHRDLKPDNVLLEPTHDGSLRAKVLDFGVARISRGLDRAAGGRKLTQVGTVVGTPGYMPPEQAVGDPVDGRADLYALGVILWEMLNGHALFSPTLELSAIVKLQYKEPIDPPHKRRPEVPKELSLLIVSMLETERENRPLDAAEVRDRMRRLLLAQTLSAAAAGVSPQLSIQGMAAITSGHPAVGGLDPSIETQGPDSVPTVTLGEAVPSSPATSTADPFGPSPASAPPDESEAEPSSGKGAKIALSLLLIASLVAAGVFAWMKIRDDAFEEGMAIGANDGEEGGGGEDPNADARARVPVPAALEEELRALTHGTSRRARRAAADRILAYDEASTPDFLRYLARLERHTQCAGMNRVLGRLGYLGDPRALPHLRARRGRTPRCSRRMLIGTIRRLERAATQRGVDEGDGEGG